MTEPVDNPTRSEILSSEETEALLQGIEDGSVQTGAGHEPGGEVRLYDFSDCERMTRGAMPTLQVINTRVARTLRNALRELLRKPVDVEARSSVMHRYSEYVATLPTPASLNVVRLHPLAGSILIVPTTRLILMSVDCFFGGRGKVADEEPAREFTAVEKRIIALLLDATFAALVDGWQSVFAVRPELIGQEQNPHFAAIASSGDRVVVTEFCVRLGEQETVLQIVVPRTVLEPVEERLDTAPRGENERHAEAWQQGLRRQFERTPIALSATLTSVRLRLARLLSLKAGDVISVNLPDEITLDANDKPLFTGRAGASRKRNAIVIDARVQAEKTDENGEDK